MVYHLSTCAEIPVSIGLQRSFYSVGEDGGSVEVCTEVKSGSLAGSAIHFNYTTINGMAVGTLVVNCNLTSIALLIALSIQYIIMKSVYHLIYSL